MENIETFEQFLATESAQFSAWNYIINLILTALLAYLLGLLYNQFGNSLSNRRSFGKNFIMLAVTTMIIITIVKSSLALSLGLVGALSIVRFRAAIKEPEELTYLFLNIAIGLGFGADQRAATILGFIFISIILISKNFMHKKSNDENQNIIFNISSNSPTFNQINEISELLKQFCLKVELKRFDEDKSSMEISFIVEIENFKKINIVKNKLQEKYNDLTISLIDNNLNL